MKINFSALFNTPLQKYNIYFIYGNDMSVGERIISFLQKKHSRSLNIKTEAEFLNQSSSQPSLFDDESRAPLTLVPNVTDKIISQVEQIKADITIFTSEKTRAGSKLLTFFSESPNSLAIGAYSSPLLRPEFEFMVKEMALPEAFKELLFKNYQHDYISLLSTLQKIELFGTIAEDDYASFLNIPSFSDELSPLLHAFLLKDMKRATEVLSSLSQSDFISSLRTLSRSFLTLFDLIPYKNSPKSISWMKQNPPVFFKDQPLFEAALQRWTQEDVRKFLEALLSLEVKVKYSACGLPQVCQTLIKQVG